MKSTQAFIAHERNVEKSLDKILSKIYGFRSLKNENVLTKPNWVNGRPSNTGATTSLFLIEKVIEFLLSKDANIVIG